jgi:hypothetical protein
MRRTARIQGPQRLMKATRRTASPSRTWRPSPRPGRSGGRVPVRLRRRPCGRCRCGRGWHRRQARPRCQPAPAEEAAPDITAGFSPEPGLAQGAGSVSAAGRWTEIQAMFVDDPRASVELAPDLVDDGLEAFVASARQLQGSLRSAWGGSDADTEQLRRALQRYRAFWGICTASPLNRDHDRRTRTGAALRPSGRARRRESWRESASARGSARPW